MEKALSLILALVILIGLLPQMVLFAKTEEMVPAKSELAGKTISILGDSISTFGGVSNNTNSNSTIGSNLTYYSGQDGITRADTWWQQTIDALNMELLVNNSWSGSCILHTQSGTVGAYVDRCVQLHNDHTGEEPDVIVVFTGTNDYSFYQGTLGTADLNYDALITENGDGTFTYATPATSCEAYAVMLHKMTHRYPDAEIYCMTMLPRRDPDYDGMDVVPAPTAFNAELARIITHFGCTVVDLEHCGITPEPANFDTYIGDKRVHPSKAGMNKMAEELVSTMLGRVVKLYSVTAELTNAELKGSRVAISGDTYTAEVSPVDRFGDLTVKVTMGGEDITSSCYSDGVITIPCVTGEITVTVSALEWDPKNFRWEFNGSGLVSSGEDQNTLTLKGGSVTNGLLMNVYYALANSVILSHDQPWVVEFKASGNWSGMILSADASAGASGNTYLFKTTGSNSFMSFGECSEGQFNNYGIALGPYGVDTTVEHIYRVENRISADGNNMAYLLVDGVEYGALDHYFVGGSTDMGVDVDWLNGRDLVFSYIGAANHAMDKCALDYLQIWEAGHTHDYTPVVTPPTCTEQGYTTYTCSCGDSYVDNYVDATGEHTYENGICTGCGMVDSSAAPAKLYMYSISLRGNIAINYYMELSSEVVADATAFMRFTFADNSTIEIPVSKATPQTRNGKDYYVFSCAVDAKEMTDVVKARFFYSGGSTQEYGYNVQSYAQYFLENSNDEGLKALLKAMLNYGAASQLHFGYNTDKLANACLDSAPDYSDVSIGGFNAVTGQGTELAKFYSASLILKSETTLRFFFTGSFTATYNGNALEVKERDGLYYADIVGISAKDLDEDVTITINDGKRSADVTFNPLAYCAAVRNDESGAFDQKTKNLVSALYLYNQAANTYLEGN